MNNQETVNPCPICELPTTRFRPIDELVDIGCERCGGFRITREAIDDLPARRCGWDESKFKIVLSYTLRKMQANDTPMIDLQLITEIYESRESPTPAEQCANLLLLLGDRLRHSPGSYSEWPISELKELAARIGAGEANDCHYILGQLKDQMLVENHPTPVMDKIRMHPTLAGWNEIDRLRREVVESKSAFMAMPYGDDELDQVFENVYRPAVEETGFTLRRLDEDPKAGSIVNRMRVEIQRCRFLIAELTNDNPGAYWEAGFAEGLARPVIYTCRRGIETHFDTRQLQTVFWEPENLASAAAHLKAAIRATLPAEAILEDD